MSDDSAAPRFDIAAQVNRLGADSLLPPPRFTRAQLAALARIRDRGSAAWCSGSRAGGATARMIDHLVASGYLTGPPYEITSKGRDALATAQSNQKETTDVR